MGGRGASSGGGGAASGGGGGLTGSEKQIAYGNSIMSKAQGQYQAKVNTMTSHPSPGMRLPGGRDAFVKAYTNAWNSHANGPASWWIGKGSSAANAIDSEAHSAFNSWVRSQGG
jgi:hypothetical protein